MFYELFIMKVTKLCPEGNIVYFSKLLMTKLCIFDGCTANADTQRDLNFVLQRCFAQYPLSQSPFYFCLPDLLKPSQNKKGQKISSCTIFDSFFSAATVLIRRAHDLNLVMMSSLASTCQDFKLKDLQFHIIKWLKKQVSQL